MRMTSAILAISLTGCGVFGPMVLPDYNAKTKLGKPGMTFFDVRTAPYIWGCTNEEEDGVPLRRVMVYAWIRNPTLADDDTHVTMRINERDDTIVEFPEPSPSYSWSLSFRGEEGGHKVEVWWLRGKKILAYRKRIVGIANCRLTP